LLTWRRRPAPPQKPKLSKEEARAQAEALRKCAPGAQPNARNA